MTQFTRTSALKALDLASNPTDEEIKKAYRKLAMKHHPDRGGSADKFKHVQGAYDYLSNPKNKSKTAASKSTANSTTNYTAFQDLYESMWGTKDYQNEFEEAPNKTAAEWGSKNLSRELSSYVTVRLSEAFKGVKTSVQFPSIAEGKSFEIDIPKMAQPGMLLRTITVNSLYGEKIVISVRLKISLPEGCSVVWAKTPNLYGGAIENSGNIEYEKTISWLDVVNGGFITVPTVDGGMVEVRIPAGLENGSRLRIKERGYWKDFSSKARGDMLLRIKYDIPSIDKMSKEELKKAIDLFEKELAHR